MTKKSWKLARSPGACKHITRQARIAVSIIFCIWSERGKGKGATFCTLPHSFSSYARLLSCLSILTYPLHSWCHSDCVISCAKCVIEINLLQVFISHSMQCLLCSTGIHFLHNVTLAWCADGASKTMPIAEPRLLMPVAYKVSFWLRYYLWMLRQLPQLTHTPVQHSTCICTVNLGINLYMFTLWYQSVTSVSDAVLRQAKMDF